MARLCVGCGICLGLCPAKAVKLNVSHMLTVSFDYSRCTRCAKCVRACPALSNFFGNESTVADSLGGVQKTFFGYSTDDDIRYHGASGGVATCLVLFMLKTKIVDKVLVTKLDGFFATPVLTDDVEQVVSAQGTIYFKTFSLRVLQQLLFDLRRGKKICVVGLPCQVSALKKTLKNFEDKLFTISLECAHVNEFWYLSHIVEGCLPKTAEPIAIKPRTDGWPGQNKLVFKSDNKFKELVIPNLWGNMSMLNISAPLGCLLCKDHLGGSADIMVGDAWHPRFPTKDSSGVSVIVARTPKGLEVIDKAIKHKTLYVETATLPDFLIAQGFNLLEGTQYATLRQKFFQHQVAVLWGLTEIDKIITLLLTILTIHFLKFKAIRRLLSSSCAEKTFGLTLGFLSRQKRRKMQKIISSLIKVEEYATS